MPAGGYLTSGAVGLGEAVVGLINSGKAKREAAKLQASRPQYTQSPYDKDALALAQSEVSTGMSGEAKNAYEQGIDRDLSGSLSTILKGGGSVNNVAEVFDHANQGRQKLAIMKDNLRLNQIHGLVTAQELNSQEREKAFQFNQWAPWADSAKANAGARTAADGQIWGGVNTLGSAIMGFGHELAAKKDTNNYFASNPERAGGGGRTFSGSYQVPLASTSGGAPNTSGIAPAFIGPNSGPNFSSPNVAPATFNLDQSSLPDISTLE